MRPLSLPARARLAVSLTNPPGRSEVVTLIPAVLAFFVRAPPDGERGPGWNDALLFSGMALSRIGLWSFDLCQLKELQEALNDHPQRNSMCVPPLPSLVRVERDPSAER